MFTNKVFTAIMDAVVTAKNRTVKRIETPLPTYSPQNAAVVPPSGLA